LLFVVSCSNGGAIMGTSRGVRKERAVVAVCWVRVRGEVTIRLIYLDRG
jgi:cysteine synthase